MTRDVRGSLAAVFVLVASAVAIGTLHGGGPAAALLARLRVAVACDAGTACGDRLVAAAPGGVVEVTGWREALAAVRAGDADVAAVPAGLVDPADGLVVLDADHAGAVLPLHREEMARLFPTLPADVDAVSRALDDGSLAAGGDVPFVAADRGGAPLVVTGWPDAALGDLYATELRRAGYDVVAPPALRSGEEAVLALAGGTVHVLVAPPGDVLAALDGRAPATPPAVHAAAKDLRARLAAAGVTTASLPAWSAAAALVTTADVAGVLRGGAPVDVADVVPAAHPSAGGPVDLPGDGDGTLRWADTGPAVVGLQHLLRLLGRPVEVTGVYDAATRDAVRAVQSAAGVAADGIAGPATLSLLADMRRAQAMPTAAPAAGERVVHLTFDDGPDPVWTPQVLDLLARHGARATFFVVGTSVANVPDLAARLVDDGHAIANHTHHHVPLDTASDYAVQHEVGSASVAIEAATGRWPACLRPPMGRSTAGTRDAVDGYGYRWVEWDVDTGDWRRPGVDAIVDRVLGNLAPGAVVLLHDGGGDRSQTVAALERILVELDRLDYRVEPVPGC